nr:LysR family transcriptional regulator [Streptomyces sp. V2]
MADMRNEHGSAASASASGELSTVWLRVFLEVARQGSFTGAARDLGWTQSAVSRQVASLEGALGSGPLFERLPRGVRLTEAGRVLVPYAQTVADVLVDVRRELGALRAGTAGRLRFGAFASADVALVPRALARFRAERPGVAVSREEGFTAGLLERLAAGHLDVAVVSTTGGASFAPYELRHLLDEFLYVALPAGHPLAGAPDVRLAQLADADWISGGPHPEGTLLDAASRQGFRPRVAHVVGEWTAKLGYVAAGLGVALVPALAAGAVRRDVALVRVVDEGGPARAVYAATVRGRAVPAAGEAFVEVLAETARAMAWTTPGTG